MSSRSEFRDRLNREVQEGKITRKQRQQCLESHDRRQADDRDPVGDATEGVLGFIWEALGLSRED